MDRHTTLPHEHSDTAIPKVRTFTRRDLLAISAAGAAALLPGFGCGGGHSSIQGGAGGGAALTPAQRTAILTGIGQKYEALPHQSQDADNDLMAAYLASLPNLRSVQLTGAGTIAARFTDGPGYVFINNLDDSRDTGRSPIALSKQITRAANQIPENGATFLLNGLAVILGAGNPVNQFINSLRAQAHVSRLDGMFKLRGYQTTTSAASIASLRGIKNAGVFYFIGHGGLGIDENNKQIFIINTTDASDAAIVDEKLVADIKADYVGYTTFTGTDGTGKRRAEAAYYITPSFVTNYMSFSKYSVAFVNGCASVASATPNPTLPAPKFDQAFFTAQASAYIGWDDKVNASDVRDSAEFFFDRLLGANVSDAPGVKQSVPVRPFDYSPILIEMQTVHQSGQSLNLTQSLDSDPPRQGETRKTANLVIEANSKDPDTFALLAPTIDNLIAEEIGRTLTVNGIFGTSPGTVTMAGSALSINQWTSTQIICGLPIRGGGDVVVTARGHSSTPHRLTEWILPIHYRGQPAGMGDSHTESVDLMLLMRADVLLSRSFPGGSVPGPYDNLQPSPSPGSSGNYAVSGEFEGDLFGLHHVVSYTGSGALKPPALPALTGEIYFNPRFDFTPKTIALSFSVHVAKAGTDTIGNPGATSTTDLAFGLRSDYWGDATTGLIHMKMDDNYIILPGTLTRSVPPGAGFTGQPNLNTTLTWDQTAPTPGTEPTLDQPRSTALTSIGSKGPGRR